MNATADFANDPLENMVAVGAIGTRSARVWVRSQLAGRFALRWWPRDAAEQRACIEFDISEPNDSDNTLSIEVPGERLQPRRCYEFDVIRLDNGQCLGQGRFETAPEDMADVDGRFSFALMSCNQPFDDEGRPTERAASMLRAARRCLRAHNTKLVLTIGDQMYSDYPPTLSLAKNSHFASVAPPNRAQLSECTAAEVRQLYQRRYRHFWNVPEWRALLSEYPCYPMLDDHEIIDDWGSLPEHRAPEWRAVCTGARAAYFDYQGSRVAPSTVLPDNFDYSIAYGNIAIYVLDLRSHRQAGNDAKLYSEVQFEKLDAFLRDNRELPLIFIVFTVPIVHLPPRVASLVSKLPCVGEDFSDRWSTAGHIDDRDRMLKRLDQHMRDHSKQRLVFLSGDIHLGCAHEIRWDGGNVCYQFVSSGITHAVSAVAGVASLLSMRRNISLATADGELRGEARLLGGEEQHRDNPYADLNFGIVEIDASGKRERPGLRLLLYGHDGDEPVCRYRSPEL